MQKFLRKQALWGCIREKHLPKNDVHEGSKTLLITACDLGPISQGPGEQLMMWISKEGGGTQCACRCCHCWSHWTAAKGLPLPVFNGADSLTCTSRDSLACFSSFPTTPEFSDLRDLQGCSLSDPQSSSPASSRHRGAAIDIDDGSLYKSVWWGPVCAQTMWSSSILDYM